MRDLALLNWLHVDKNAPVALYMQIATQLREAILNGHLTVGADLPSSRTLAKDLGVSRITTSQAYDQLVAESFLETKRGSGTHVSKSLSMTGLSHLAAARHKVYNPISSSEKHLFRVYGEESTNVLFRPGIPAFDVFPHRLWSRLLARHSVRQDFDLLDYAHVGGYGPLRLEIARYLRGSRGIVCDPECVIVVTSVRSAIAAICAALWRRNSTIAVEDPGYKVARNVLMRAGQRLLPVPVDERGLCVSELLTSPTACVGAYLTPAHHWPTGAALSAQRRLRLLDWATETGAWIIEDDYDSEFRFDSAPLGTLHALGSGRVIYVGTFSKTFAPSVRVAYLVVPKENVQVFERTVFEIATEPALHVQAALSEFLGEGYFTQHIGRMRRLYAKRRTLLVEALGRVFGNRLRLTIPPGGLQIIASLPQNVCATEFSRRAACVDIVVNDLAVNCVKQPSPNALHIGFTGVSEHRIEPAIQKLAQAVDDLF